MLTRFFLLVLLLLVVPAVRGQEPAPKADFYVAPDGNDTWSGKFLGPNEDGTDGPLASLAGARDAVRKLRKDGPLDQPIRILVRGGTYRIDGPIVFAPEDSGSQAAPITYEAWPKEKPVFSGGVKITGWQKESEGPLWTTVVPQVAKDNSGFRQLWVNGRRCVSARSPNEETFRSAGPGVTYTDREEARRDPKTKQSIFYQDDDLRQWPDLADAVVVVYHSWTTSRHRIKSLDPEKHLVEFTADSGWPMGWWEKDQRYFVEGIREALDAPGEFHLDRSTGVLSYYPRPGEDMKTVDVVAPREKDLLRLAGDPASGKFVDHLHFKGLTFAHADWFMPEATRVDGQAAAFLRNAAVFARGARHCLFEACEVAHTGGYGVWLENGCKDNRLVQCHIHDLGAGGIRLGHMTLPSEPQEQAERNEIYNCFIHDGGKVYHAGVGVWIGRSSRNTVHHNEISDFLYTGVSVGWSWGYAPSTAHHNVIDSNHIHHLGWGQLSDMGGIYCLGLAPGTQLTRNVIHDVLSYNYGGWGLYTDEGSTGVVMENNIVYRVKDGAFHQHYGRDNILRNNVLGMSATFGQIRRSREEDHSSFTAERNIIYCHPAQPLGGKWENGNYTLRDNLYFRPEGDIRFPGDLTFSQWQEKGHDSGSIVADPKFVSVEEFDFRLQTDSPALKLGFKPIDSSAVGLVGPAEWTDLPKKVKRSVLKLPGE
ncbi:MAG: right-handed parallel beta-helix repeat-containing protein [Planctomycetes bacterium]|nr:right-handed parallel beta-helix repeat-containing protein [Planctomycetota bacterium]